jgi:hypothetical protein
MKISKRQLQSIILKEIMGPGEKVAAGMSSGGEASKMFNKQGFIKDPLSFADFLHTGLAATSIVDPTMLSDDIDSLVYYFQGKKKEAALVLALSVGGIGAGALAVKGMKSLKAAKVAKSSKATSAIKEIPDKKITDFKSVGQQADNIISETQAKLGEKNAKEFLEYYREILEKKQDYDIDYDEFVKLRDAYFKKIGKEGASQVGTKSAKAFAKMNVGDTFTTTEKMYAYVALPANLKKGTKLKPTSRGKGDNTMDMIEREIEVWRKTNAPDKASRIDCFYASWRPDGGSWVDPKGSRNTVYMIEIQPGTKISMYNGNSFSDSVDYVAPHAIGKSTGRMRPGRYGTGSERAYKGSEKAKSYEGDMDVLDNYFGTRNDPDLPNASPADDYGFSGSDHHELVMNGPSPVIVKKVDAPEAVLKEAIKRKQLRKLILKELKDIGRM